jgi:type IV pilus assembly protein PilA
MGRYPRERGFTLVELMIVITLVGVLASLAIYGVRRYLNSARTAEAKYSIGAISQLATGVFEREISDAEFVANGALSKAAVNRLCASAQSVPDTVPQGKKYQPSNAVGDDFHTGNSAEGWLCLRYTMSAPIYYQYSYHRSDSYVSPALGGPDPGVDGFEAAAQGDSDADSILSTFARTGTIVGKSLKVSTQIFVFEEFE